MGAVASVKSRNSAAPCGHNTIHSPQVFFFHAMTVTQEDGGRLNAFAREPKMVIAEPLTGAEQRQRLRLYGLGVVLVVVTMAVTAWVSRGLV